MDFVPNTDADRQQMLRAIGVQTIDDLLNVVPETVRHPSLRLPEPMTEMELMAEMRAMAGQNADAQHFACFLGAGAYHHYIPSAISQLLLRSEFYTAYTPYQAEISQGTLQSAFEFQSMICSLFGMEVTNSSMYDGATSLAEAALMAVAATHRRKVVVSGTVNPEYRAVLKGYMQSRGVQVVASAVAREGDRIVEEPLEQILDDQCACCIVQQPNFLGGVRDLAAIADRTHEVGALFIVSADPISLGLLKSPGEWGADIAVGEGQGLGNAMSFGGPYLGLLACRERLVRQMPGRLVGATTDAKGRRGFVLTMQAREQHIRREKATSNICTSEQLLALSAAIYMSLMGPVGLRKVAQLCYDKAHYAAKGVASVKGYRVLDTGSFFNEFVVECPLPPAEISHELLNRGIIGGYDLAVLGPSLKGCMLMCATETNTRGQIDGLASALSEIAASQGGVR
ncbi:MAG TPA: aminomethyl-transferring glycine dehydrogenase subunit GcvPA [Chloroflexota bacterium]|nr:aminomethyl-transferring glycine dehydrogenase subunit GcvPA [Chloroflexota bacterium]